MTVVRIFAKAHVRNDKELQFCFANRFNRPLHHALFAEGTGAVRVLGFGQPKKYDSRNPQRLHFAALFHNLIDGLLIDTGHGADFLADLRPRAHEHRIDNTRRSKTRLSNQATQRLAPPQTPRPMSRKTHTLFTPAFSCFTVPAKCFSNASITAAAVVSAEITRRRPPASRKAFAVTGPTAAIASLSCSARNCSPPNNSAKCWTADGLKKRTASAAPSAICLMFRSLIAVGRSVRYATTSVNTAPCCSNAGGKSGFARSLRGKNTFAPRSRSPNSPPPPPPLSISPTSPPQTPTSPPPP